MNILKDGVVEVDLVLSSDPSITVPPIAAWESHLALSDTTLMTIVPGLSDGEPVQEQGRALALDGMTSLSSGSGSVTGDYFTAQNRYDPASGTVDYSVTLVKGNNGAIQLGPGQTRAVIGRIAVQGISEGSASLDVVDSSQVVTREPAGPPVSVALSPTATSTTINVGPVTNPEVHGTLSSRTPVGSLPAAVALSFWLPGSVPAWRGGNDRPVATYRGIALDANGDFRVADISPSIVPPGTYDLRLKGDGTLPRLLQNVAVPPTSSPPTVISIVLPHLLLGDVDGDGAVDIGDVQLIRDGFGSSPGSRLFNDSADFNRDGIVDAEDFSTLSRNVGGTGE